MPSDVSTTRPAETRGAPPSWLDERGRRLWRRLQPDLPDDAESQRRLADLCWAQSWYERVAGLLERLHPADRSWRDRDGLVHPHPAVRLEELLSGDLYELSLSLGLEAMGRPQRRRTTIVFLDEGE